MFQHFFDSSDVTLVQKMNKDLVVGAFTEFLGLWATNGKASLAMETNNGFTNINFSAQLGHPSSPPHPRQQPAPAKPRHRGPAERAKGRERAADHQANPAAAVLPKTSSLPTTPITSTPISSTMAAASLPSSSLTQPPIISPSTFATNTSSSLTAAAVTPAIVTSPPPAECQATPAPRVPWKPGETQTDCMLKCDAEGLLFNSMCDLRKHLKMAHDKLRYAKILHTNDCSCKLPKTAEVRMKEDSKGEWVIDRRKGWPPLPSCVKEF